MSSNITSYQNNGVFYYQKQGVSTQGASGVSGASEVSGASGVVVQDLDISDIIALFRRGDLTPAEMDKWLNAHSKQIKDSSKSEEGNEITYKFTYNNIKYSVSCDKSAAESQTDNIKQQTYSLADLLNKGIPQDKITTYFESASSANSRATSYKLKDDAGFDTVEDLSAHLNKEKNFEALKNKFSNLDKIIEAIRKYIDAIHSGDKSILAKLKTAVSSLNTQYTSIQDSAGNYKLDNYEKYTELKNKYDKQVEGVETAVANCIASGKIDKEDVETIGASIGKNNNKKPNLKDLMDKFIEYVANYTKTAGKITKEKFKNLFKFFISQQGIKHAEQVSEEAIDDLYLKYDKGGLDGEKTEDYATRIEDSDEIANKKDALIKKLDYYTDLVKKCIQKKDKITLLGLIPKITDLAKSLLEFIKTINDTTFGGTGAIEEISEKYNDLLDELTALENTDEQIKDYAEELEQINDIKGQIEKRTMKYNDVQGKIDKLFEDKETVTLDELLSIFSDEAYGDTKTEIDINNLITMLEEIEDDQSKTLTTGTRQKRSGLAASQAHLLLITLRQYQTNQEPLTQDKMTITEQDLAELLRQAGINGDELLEQIFGKVDFDELSKYYNDKDLEEIAQKFGLDYSEVKISVADLKKALSEKFAGRDDITKAEVESAIKTIYMQRCYEASYDKMKNESITEISDSSILDAQETMDAQMDAIKKAMNDIAEEYFSIYNEKDETAIALMDDLIGIYTAVLGYMSNIMQALANGDYDKAESALKNLTQLLERLSKMSDNESESISEEAYEDINKAIGAMTAVVQQAKAENV